jgi:hypothetical protein
MVTKQKHSLLIIGFDGNPMIFSPPWDPFYNSLKSKYEINNLEYNECKEYFLVSLNYHKNLLKITQDFSIPLNNRILIVMEPKIVAPENYLNATRNLFRYVFVASPLWKLNKNEIVFNWPQRIDLNKTENLIKKSRYRNLNPVMINSNKISFIAGEMYTLRRKVLLSEPKILLFGKNWNFSSYFSLRFFLNNLKNASTKSFTYKTNFINARVLVTNFFTIFKKKNNYIGPVESKSIVYQRHDFAVVIENELTYVSEKLFDVINEGCIPIYVGPDLEKFNLRLPSQLIVIPEAVAIKNKIKELTNISELDKVSLRRELFSFLKLNYQTSNSDYVFRSLAEKIDNLFQNN